MSYIEIRVVETRGSTPREAGTRMWVGSTEIRGTIGGGQLEYTALKIAREMLLSGDCEHGCTIKVSRKEDQDHLTFTATEGKKKPKAEGKDKPVEAGAETQG